MSAKINSVQALRGIAAIMVMFFHYRFLINDSHDGLGDKLFIYGGYGVDIFFVISGFVITLSSIDKPTGFQGAFHFIKNRAKRLLPAYFIILIITLALSGGLSLFHYHNKVENLISALFFIPIYASKSPVFIDTSEIYGVRWTLNYEMYFYFVMACSMLFTRRWLVMFAWFAIALIVVPVCLTQTIPLQPGVVLSQSAYFNLMTNPMVFEFLIGVTLGLAYKKIKCVNGYAKIITTLLSLLCIMFLYKSHGGLDRENMQVGLISGLLFLIIIINEKFLESITPRFLVFLGEISFSLYLIHNAMNSIVNRRLDKLGVPDGLGKFILYSVLSIFLAWLSYRYIERATFSRKKRLQLSNGD
ncbi:acyltransferase [Buttiauxella sp. S04-F03]|uniref:acyltransferase family protein n=1 Tax=Buttiauxella sp. S04-F03 TaxID=2904525 RepID=UPI001E317EFD|nr:acyltransferase [Buttiauxella sp. S04-F03]MCE0812434.1 acyltransferase [Buttiauxella sp. S04-F03]